MRAQTTSISFAKKIFGGIKKLISSPKFIDAMISLNQPWFGQTCRVRFSWTMRLIVLKTFDNIVWNFCKKSCNARRVFCVRCTANLQLLPSSIEQSISTVLVKFKSKTSGLGFSVAVAKQIIELREFQISRQFLLVIIFWPHRYHWAYLSSANRYYFVRNMGICLSYSKASQHSFWKSRGQFNIASSSGSVISLFL